MIHVIVPASVQTVCATTTKLQTVWRSHLACGSLYVPKTAIQVETSSFPDVGVGITYCHSVQATSHLRPLNHKRLDLQLYVLNWVDKWSFHGTGYRQETWGCPAMTKWVKLGCRTRSPQPCIQRVQDLQLHCWTTLRKRSYTFIEHSHKPWLSIGAYLHLGRNTKRGQAKNMRRHVLSHDVRPGRRSLSKACGEWSAKCFNHLAYLELPGSYIFRCIVWNKV